MKMMVVPIALEDWDLPRRSLIGRPGYSSENRGHPNESIAKKNINRSIDVMKRPTGSLDIQ